MLELLTNIIVNVLTALYTPFGFAVFSAVLLLFLYILVEEYGGGSTGFKKAIKKWAELFKTRSVFRKAFFLAFYTMMILFQTLLNRQLWTNPLSDVMGGWGLTNANGEFTTESIENILLFLPFTILLFWTFYSSLCKERDSFLWILWQSAKITFLFSISIEALQLFLRLGTFQIADLVYNTLGGAIGGTLYYIFHKIAHKS